MRWHLLPLTLVACTSASAATRSFPVGGFDRIESTGSWDVRVRTGAAPSAMATGDQRMLDRLTVEVRDGALVIGSTPGAAMSWSWSAHPRTIVDVTVPMLRGATLTGSGDVRIDHVRGASFDGTLTGSGDLTIAAIEVPEVALTLRGSGDLKAAGEVRRARIVMHGSGDLDAGGLRAIDAVIDATGSGDTHVGASGTSTISLTGSGDVTVTGGARCATTKHGSGDVDCR